MIEIKDKADCCGCEACVQACPKSCISFKLDEEGFRYPFVDKNLCIDCHICEKVCPVINQSQAKKPIAIYGAKNFDSRIRNESSSGGIFTLLAENIIDEGGVVFGVKFDKDWLAIHSYTETKEGLSEFRTSKYLQSQIGTSFKDAKNFLDKGISVLFTGTSCQIAGLKKFLRKDYENLYLIDIACHGVPSPMVWKDYLDEFIKKNLAEEKDFKISQISRENTYMRGFLKDLYLRPSCHKCPAKSLKAGSDQVWRPRYNPNQNLYFLDFTKAYKVKRIAYAASFGMDSLDEFSEKDLATAKKMLPLVDAVSVREDSGVALCKDNFSVEATHVLDPTLLLNKDDYLKLIEGDDTTNKRTNSLMVYLLDETEEKQKMIAKAETQLNLSAYILSPYKTKESPVEHKYQKPSISAWLAGYRDTSFVLTDSFHGVIFSIIFNKNFIAINNKKRGSARFDSLLRLFGLEDRLISDISQLNLEKLEDINYTQVNKILNDKKKLSLDLLSNALKK